MKIMIVEDDQTIVFSLKKFLRQLGYAVEHFSTFQQALDVMNDGFDLLLLDIGLPDGDGLELCRLIKDRYSIPVIFMTAYDNRENFEKAFNLGAEDYLSKPFKLYELEKRIDAAIKKRSNTVFKSRGLTVDLFRGKVMLDGETVNLSPQEYRLLLLLINHRNEIVSKETLFHELFGGMDYVSENALSVSMKRLRLKLKKAVFIETVHGKGYCLR